MNRDDAYLLLTEYTKSDSLIKHALAVEACMRWYAREFQVDQTYYGITGLLHDFDYERFPEPFSADNQPTGHPFAGVQILRDKQYPEEMLEAILGHAHYTNVPRTTQLAKTLFAVDELSGLVTASVYVRPDKSLHTLEVSSVKKKMKDKAFARGVNRDDVMQGAQELGIELDTHIGNVIQAMREVAPALGLNGL
ncbi:HDIG domain-containing protein [bacterium]|nr:HDIG domain-containing protein [bacterium]